MINNNSGNNCHLMSTLIMVLAHGEFMIMNTFDIHNNPVR